MNYRVVKGTRDFLPFQMQRRNYIFDTIKDVYCRHGFQQIETPALENLDTLMGKYGEEGDKLLFKILNSGDFTENKDLSSGNYKQITKEMYWVDDQKSKYYNQLVDITKVEKDWMSGEHLIEYPIQYEYLIEIKTNPDNIPGNGSAIFLHCSNKQSTSGCISINRIIMKKIIQNIDKDNIIKTVKEPRLLLLFLIQNT